jgi:glycerol-3-phosphate dehydrogenase
LARNFDILIVGGGAVGSAIARELSRYKVHIAVVDQEGDVARGTSGRNSAVVHAGFNNRPASLMAKLCTAGNRGFAAVCQEYNIPYKKTGKLVLALTPEDIPILADLFKQGKKNGVRGLQLLTPEEVMAKEPFVAQCTAALWSRETAITNPFLYTIALADDAARNGVAFFFNSPVTSVHYAHRTFTVQAGKRTINARCLINAAGVGAATVAALAGDNRYHIYPCRGEYLILDQDTSPLLQTPVYPAPRLGLGGLGVHLTPTIDGNILVGPSAEYIDSPTDTATTEEVTARLWEEARSLLPPLTKGNIIAAYAGLRSKTVPRGGINFGDFIVDHSLPRPGLINLIGIESPGLTASLPLAQIVVQLVKDLLPLTPGKIRKTKRLPVRFREMEAGARAEAVASDPEMGDIVCRCENVTLREVLNVLDNPLKVRSLTGIRARTRCMTGRCQGGYCTQRLVQILLDAGIPPEDIRYDGADSFMFTGQVK